MVELETDTHQGIGMVDHGQEHLEVENVMVKLKTVEEKIEEGQELLKRLADEIVADCEKMKQLPAESKATVFMWNKNMPQAISDTKQDVQKAEEFCQWT